MSSIRRKSPPPPGLVYIDDYEHPDGTVTLGIASRLGITPSTYRKWRMDGRGPATFPLGKRVVARIEAVDVWISLMEQAAQVRVDHALRPAELRRSRRTPAAA